MELQYGGIQEEQELKQYYLIGRVVGVPAFTMEELREVKHAAATELMKNQRCI